MSETEGGDDVILAGEYALGVLEREDRARAAGRAARDGAFAARIVDWELRLAPLGLEVPAISPRPALKKKVLAAVFGEASAGAPTKLAAALNFWRIAAVAMAALALTSIAALIFFSAEPPERAAPRLATTVLPAGAAPVLRAEIADGAREVRIAGASIETGADEVAELWLIPPDGAPRSLGLINAQGDYAVAIPEDLRALVVEGSALAVSLEPPGGSPTGAPTGQIVGVGPLART